MNKTINGFEERAHPADLALYVWADSLSELFIQAAKGMAYLLKAGLQDGEPCTTGITCEAVDTESLLIEFLSELLYIVDEQRLLFIPTRVRMEQNHLTADLLGQKVITTGREIKAATYSNLQISKTRTGFETTIVFDI